VGLIKKLPRDLVASFRSTLDEALEASGTRLRVRGLPAAIARLRRACQG
jgi:hypothetical protein